MINLVMPFALHIGATQTLNGMNSDLELAVIEAAGGSQSIQTKPIVLLAIIMSLVALALSHFVEPWAYKHKRDIIAKAGADLVRFAVQSGTFQQLEDNLFIQIADQLPSGDFGGIFISDSRKPDTDLIYYAKRGTIRKVDGAEILVLADGEVQRKNPVTGELSIIRFESVFPRFQSVRSDRRRHQLLAPRNAAPTFCSTRRARTSSSRATSRKTFASEIYRRFSEWLYPLVFGTIAIYFAVGARSNRQERLWSLTAGVAVAVAVRGAGFFLVNVSGINSLYAFLNFADSDRFDPAVLDIDPDEQIAALLAGLGRRRRLAGGLGGALVDAAALRRRAAAAGSGRPAMIGFTLFSYLFRRYAVTFVQYFLGICVISYLVDFTEFSRFKSTLPGYTIGAGLLVSALRIPLIAQTAIPFIILFSAIATLMALNRRYELVVARSAGVSAWQFLAPLCLASLIIGILAVTVFNPLGARALSWAQQLEASFSAESQSNFDARIPWLRQRDADGVTIIGAKSTARHGLQLNQRDIRPDRPGGRDRRPNRRPAGDTRGSHVADRRRRAPASRRSAGTVRPSRSQDQPDARIRRGEAGAARNDPVLRAAAQDAGGVVVRPQRQRFRHAISFAYRAA